MSCACHAQASFFFLFPTRFAVLYTLSNVLMISRSVMFTSFFSHSTSIYCTVPAGSVLIYQHLISLEDRLRKRSITCGASKRLFMLQHNVPDGAAAAAVQDV